MFFLLGSEDQRGGGLFWSSSFNLTGLLDLGDHSGPRAQAPLPEVNRMSRFFGVSSLFFLGVQDQTLPFRGVIVFQGSSGDGGDNKETEGEPGRVRVSAD